MAPVLTKTKSLLAKLCRIPATIKASIAFKHFTALKQYRSDSDDGDYVRAVRLAYADEKAFSVFKRKPSYRKVLEHVSFEDGAKYLAHVNEHAPELLTQIDQFREQNEIGSPLIYSYPEIGEISPSTLRYIKVASDIKKTFGNLENCSIAEIGCGYGGQLLVLDQVLKKIATYEVFDLADVLNLTSKYLEGFLLNCAYKTTTLNQCDGSRDYDLVISNYAFSELPKVLQLKYIEKVLSKSRRGYLTMNTGQGERQGNNKLNLDELKELLPPFQVVDEMPLTGPDNYIIAWGTSA